ncbi:MAG: hypothetical protein NC181_02020 [Clostridium sp.]|nr:hypothetical protein [Clostridium sp.]MCM1444083.1 hypothetical protein [Candidatus Amulumruptor caecigallinarius]
MKEKKTLVKISIVLSLIAILICIGFILYGIFIEKDNDIMIWLVIGFSNLSLLFINISNYKNK